MHKREDQSDTGLLLVMLVMLVMLVLVVILRSWLCY
jgi:predicted RND superfamily exporter protein